MLINLIKKIFMTNDERKAELNRRGVAFSDDAKMADLNKLLKDNPIETEDEEVEKKDKKNPYAKYIGKKTNDGKKIIDVIVRNIKRIGQPEKEMLEIRTNLGATIINPEELDEHIK